MRGWEYNHGIMAMMHDKLLEQPRPGVLRFGGARMALLDVEAGFWGLRRQMEALVGPRLTDSVLQQAGANGGASFARAFVGECPEELDGQALLDCLAAYQAAGFGRFSVDRLEWPIGRVLIRGTDTFESWMVLQHEQGSDAPACSYTSGVLVGFANVLAGRSDIVCVKRACQAQGAEACLFELLPAELAGDIPVIAYDPDPALGRQINLLESLFDRMPMGIVILDQDLRIRRFNPTWAELVHGYTAAKTHELGPGVSLFRLAPGIEAAFRPMLERALSGETVRQEAFRLEIEGTVSFWDTVVTPLIRDGEVGGLLNVTVDATERALAEEALRESEADLRSLMNSAKNFAVYRVTIDPTAPHGGRVDLVSPSIKEILGISDPYRFEAWFEHVHPHDKPRVLEANRRAVETGTPYGEPTRWYHPVKQEWIWIHTASTPVFDESGHMSHAIGLVLDITEQKRAEEALQESQRRLATLISNLPGMAYRCRNDSDWTMEFVSEGSLGLTGYAPGDLVDNCRVAYGELIHPDDRNLVWEAVQAALREDRPFQISYRIVTPTGEKWVWEQGQSVLAPGGEVVALEGFVTDITERVSAKRNLEQRIEERTRELSTLLEVSHDVNAMLELEPLLGLILDELENVVSYDGSTILTVEGEYLAVRAYRGPIPQDKATGMRFPIDDPLDRRVLIGRKPVVIRDTRGDSAAAQSFRESVGEHVDTTFGHIRSWLGVPLIVKDRVIGQLTLEHGQPDRFSAQHAELVLAFANQAAVAIENARLYRAEQEQLGESERRRKVAEALRDTLEMLNSRRPLEQILDHIVEQATRLLGAHSGIIYHLEVAPDILVLQAGYQVPEQLAALREIPLYEGGAVRQMFARKPYAIADIQAHLARADTETGLQNPQLSRWLGILVKHYRAYLGLPLIIGNEVYGSLGLYYLTPHRLADEEIELGLSLANQAALAIQNARLSHAEKERQRELQTLLDITSTASRSLDLDEVLTTTLDHLLARVGASRAGVMLLNDASNQLEARAIRPETVIAADDMAQMTEAGYGVIGTGAPLYVQPDPARGLIEPGALLPLRVRGKANGVLVIVGQEGARFSQGQQVLFGSIADQLGIAVENAWLFEQAEDTAVAAERSRLARDLHDAVTQTLFSSSLIAEVLPRLWERDPEEGRRRLQELRELTRGALAEMRTLLLELRPSALVEARLSDLLSQLAESIAGRARVPVELEVAGECSLDAEVKVALYRIAQEALNNIAKHAGASAATIRLNCQPGRVDLRVADDGLGFDPATLPANSLGLGIMRERAQSIGAELRVDSQPGTGTEIGVTWRSYRQ
jgi:PAS domain S-box-containing protein